MFKKIEPLAKEKHQDLRYNPIRTFDYARHVSSCQVTISEFNTAFKYYPIVFNKNNNWPILIFSFLKDFNNYINDDGTWKVSYVPVYIRKYPFVLARISGKEDENVKQSYALCIDPDAPHFESPYGELLFTANGDPTNFTINNLDCLKKIQGEMAVTENFVNLLNQYDLLVERNLGIEKNGQKYTITGFKVIDTVKLNALDDAVLADWVRKGVMSLIVAHTNSLSNLVMLTGQ